MEKQRDRDRVKGQRGKNRGTELRDREGRTETALQDREGKTEGQRQS